MFSSKKTTTIGLVALILLIASMVLVYLDKATLTEATAGLTAITAFTTFLLGLNAKDNNVTHSCSSKGSCPKKATKPQDAKK